VKNKVFSNDIGHLLVAFFLRLIDAFASREHFTVNRLNSTSRITAVGGIPYSWKYFAPNCLFLSKFCSEDHLIKRTVTTYDTAVKSPVD
jgi:hypothetical protein